MAGVRGQHASVAENKGLAFSMELDEKLPDSLLGDVGKLRQCLGCLLDNAIKFTRAGSVNIRVSSQFRGAEKYQLLFEVIDTGIGFTHLDEATLYQTFFQVDGSMTREHGGLGIGLAICRQLVGLMGGSLSHESEPGRGSCFRLSLELLHCDSTPLVKPAVIQDQWSL
jgi:signal transduction histidine kinase